MRLDKLTKEQVTQIYEEHMVFDFPSNELKPLSMMLKGMDDGEYECFGLMDGESITGYTYLIKHGRDYLIDYIAIFPMHRNCGYGSTLLRLLGDYLTGAESIIGEVENPEFAESEEERILQTRRIGFYMRNGFRDTGLRVLCFGAHFIMIEMGPGLIHSAEEIKELYLMHFRAFLPEEKIAQNLIF